MARPSLAQAVRDAHQRGRIIVMDGPMATDPEQVKVVYEDYVNAGAEVLLSNTFSAHLGLLKGERDWREAVAAGLELARQPEWDHCYVLGSIGSAVGGDEQAIHAIQQVMSELAGCDGIFLETQTRLDRARTITESMRSEGEATAEPQTARDLIVSFSFNRLPRQDRCWIVEAPNEEERMASDVARWAKNAPLLALGVNCGNNLRLADTVKIAQDYHSECNLPILVRPGITPSIECEFLPREFAAAVKYLADAGVTLIGGCCGTTPAHIAAVRKEVDRLGLGWQD
jgi:methionine synthase I (cobalamin-dependent)